jgi:hypothetical protein
MKRSVQFFVILFVMGAFFTLSAQTSNVLTDQEKKEGWTLLFDGKNFDGWRKCNDTSMPSNWTIDDNAMKVGGNKERPGRGQGGDILFAAKKYGNFEISIDWKIQKGGNSGIFYNVVEYPGKDIYYAAPEVQVLDNWYASDNKLTNHLSGSLYDILPALPQNARPANEWNTIVIKVKDGKATHTQNGVKVVEYELWSPQWYDMIAKSKFKDWEGFKNGPAKEGFIGLQDHGYDCWFRNIKIREL